MTTNYKSYWMWGHLSLAFTLGLLISCLITSTSIEKFMFFLLALVVLAGFVTIFALIFSVDDAPVPDLIVDFNIKAFIVGKQRVLMPFIKFEEISLGESDWFGFGSRYIIGISRYERTTCYGPFVLSAELTDRLKRISVDLYDIDEKTQDRHLYDKSADLRSILNCHKLKSHWKVLSAWKQVGARRYYGLTTTLNEGTTAKMIHWDENAWCLTSFSRDTSSGSDLREWWSAL